MVEGDNTLKMYQISCMSNCGTYFQAYLQSVDVIAFNQDQAMELLEKWMNTSGERFVHSRQHWHVECLGPVNTPSVINFHIDSDY